MMWHQLSFQDATSPTMYSLTMFHDSAMMFIIFIITYVALTMLSMLTMLTSSKSPHEIHELEMIWTFLPALILIFLALPSLRLLYLLDETSHPIITIKTIAHQWYWSYEYADFPALEFDSYMSPPQELISGDLRLLETDNHVALPWGMEIRMLVTAADVLHAWTIPSMGVKVDAVPGRLNQLTLFTPQSNISYGQCSEICGANHSFMPITLEFTPPNTWLTWALHMTAN